ncbi:MAG: YIP1 family protein [Clostridia bacterium]|nr:YIP1 family protein [Clostridia bacterium]
MKNIFKTFLNIFIKPVTTTDKEVETATLKFGFIHAAIITAVFAICSFISTVISQLFVKRYDYSLGKRVTKIAFDNLKILELAGSLFGTIILIFGFIVAFAGIMLLIAKILKTKTTFAKTLKISTFAMTPYMVATLLSLIFAWFSPIGTTLTAIAKVYFVLIAVLSFVKILGEENKDKLALCYIILIGGFTLIISVGTFILSLIGSNILSSIGL